MLKFSVTLIFIVLFNTFDGISQEKDTQTTYYFIRHAEKMRANPSDLDPDLSAKGFYRAQHWQKTFKNLTFDEIYSTNYKRTLKTVEPIAKQHQITIKIYNPSTINIEDFVASTRTKTILVVGHSNTIPNFVNSIIGAENYEEIDDNNNSNLYVITIKNGLITHQLKKIDMEYIAK